VAVSAGAGKIDVIAVVIDVAMMMENAPVFQSQVGDQLLAWKSAGLNVALLALVLGLAGCQTVKGETALGYVRARYGIGDNSDIGRIGRQQEFMDALAKKAKSKLTSPDAMYGFLQSVTKSLTTDPDMAGIKPLYGLADELKGIPSDRLSFLTVPNYGRIADQPRDGANVVWQYPQATDLFTSLAKDKEVTKAQLDASKKNVVYASSVRVQVLNGTGVPGRAAAVAERLKNAGYTVTGTGNAPGTVARTTVTYPSGLESKAAVLASRLGRKVNVGTAARLMAVAPRTLQRRLAEEGVSFQEIVDAGRRESAERLLGDASLTVSEVGYVLGFTEPSAFHRAFRRWHGVTPMQFRRTNRERN